MKKNILSILDVAEEIEDIIDLGIQLKHDVKTGKQINTLHGKTLAMIFERQSTRTRLSFEVGMMLLGGHAIFLTGGEMGIGQRESPGDIGSLGLVGVLMKGVYPDQDRWFLLCWNSLA